MSPATPANLDGIGLINFVDFAIFAADWRLTGQGLVGDIIQDQVVDFKDLARIALYWLDNCSEPN